jgi:hypothetical protein
LADAFLAPPPPDSVFLRGFEREGDLREGLRVRAVADAIRGLVAAGAAERDSSRRRVLTLRGAPLDSLPGDPVSVRRLIDSLNALGVGELQTLLHRLDEARTALRDRSELAEVDSCLEEARTALVGGDLKTYRKRIERAVAQLGHASDD